MVKISNNKCSWKKLLKGIPQSVGAWIIFIQCFHKWAVVWRFVIHVIFRIDDNSLSVIWNTVNLLLRSFKKDAENTMSLFTKNFMKANPDIY